MLESEFRSRLEASGFPQPSDHEYLGNNDVDMHTHDFDVMLLVTEGEFELILEGESTVYSTGDTCTLKAGTLHTEKTGPAGAKALLSKRPALA